MATKVNIAKNVSQNLDVSLNDSYKIVQFFINFVKDNSKFQKVKISSFGTFSFNTTPQRIGRNPKTKETYIIGLRKKLSFKPSNKIKESMN